MTYGETHNGAISRAQSPRSADGGSHDESRLDIRDKHLGPNSGV